jgi:hypothetical protein
MFATYCDVLLQLLHILLDTKYNTPSRLLPCGLLSVTSSFGCFTLLSYSTLDYCDGNLPFHANGQTITYLLVFEYTLLWLVQAEAPTSFDLTERL